MRAARHPGDHRHAGDDAGGEGGGDQGARCRVVLHGESVDEAQERAEALALERKLIYVHPYDDPRVIAGQGTVALEMLEECPISTRS